MGRQLGDQAVRHGAQHGVAKVLIEHAVDVGKAIQVQQRQGAIGPLAALQRHYHGVAVGQAHQRIGKGQVVDAQVQLQILQCQRGVAGKHLQQAVRQGIGCGCCLQPQQQRRAVRPWDVQAQRIVVPLVRLLLQRMAQRRGRWPRRQARQGLIAPGLACARGTEHVRAALALLQHHAGAGVVGLAQQVAQLGQQVGGKCLQIGALAQHGRSLLHALQPLAPRLQLVQVGIGRQCAAQAGKQALGLGPLAGDHTFVDVVAFDALPHRRGVVGAHQPQQAHIRVAQVFADVLHQGQRLCQLGGSIDQHQRTVAGARQQCARVLDRGGLLHREGAPLHLQALLCQSQSGLCLGTAAHQ